MKGKDINIPEECQFPNASHKEIKRMFDACTPKFNGKPIGKIVCFGTDGNIDDFAKYEEVFHKPSNYNFIPFTK